MSVALLPLRGSDCYLVRSDACPSFRFNSSLGRLPGLVNHRGSDGRIGDRKSTRLNSSHLVISYAVFCLKKTHIPDSVYRVDGHVVYETGVYGLLWADDNIQQQEAERASTWDLRVTWPRVDKPADRSNPL